MSKPWDLQEGTTLYSLVSQKHRRWYAPVYISKCWWVITHVMPTLAGTELKMYPALSAGLYHPVLQYRPRTWYTCWPCAGLLQTQDPGFYQTSWTPLQAIFLAMPSWRIQTIHILRSSSLTQPLWTFLYQSVSTPPTTHSPKYYQCVEMYAMPSTRTEPDS